MIALEQWPVDAPIPMALGDVRVCPCGAVAAPRRGQVAKYCTTACRQAHERQRRRARTIHPPAPRLPAGPLLDRVEAAGGPAALGVHYRSAEARALSRARRSGRLTERAADRLAVIVLGMHPQEVWAT